MRQNWNAHFLSFFLFLCLLTNKFLSFITRSSKISEFFTPDIWKKRRMPTFVNSIEYFSQGNQARKIY